jgi:heme exporter protein A
VERDGAIALVDERLALDGHLPLGRALAFWHAIDRTAPGADDPLAWPIWPMCRCAISPPGRRSARRWPGWRRRRRRSGCSTSRSTGWTPRGRAGAGAIEAHRAAGGLVVIASHQPLALAGLKTLAMADHVPAGETADGEEDWA